MDALRRWNGKADPEPGDVLRLREHGVAVVARCEGDQLVLHLQRAGMTVMLPWPEAYGLLVAEGAEGGVQRAAVRKASRRS
jgi:hypothetical protein